MFGSATCTAYTTSTCPAATFLLGDRYGLAHLPLYPLRFPAIYVQDTSGSGCVSVAGSKYGPGVECLDGGAMTVGQPPNVGRINNLTVTVTEWYQLKAAGITDTPAWSSAAGSLTQAQPMGIVL